MWPRPIDEALQRFRDDAVIDPDDERRREEERASFETAFEDEDEDEDEGNPRRKARHRAHKPVEPGIRPLAVDEKK